MPKKNKHKSVPSKKRWTIWISAVALIASVGIADGFLTHRWSVGNELQIAADALDNIPKVIGEWSGEDREIGEREMRVSAATGALQRTYRNRKNGDTITITLLCGPHGPIALHPPTVCFTSAGWSLDGKPKSIEVEMGKESTCTFWRAPFSRERRMAEELIVTDWGWNDGTGWKAAPSPRFDYAGTPYLYKLYITSSKDLATEDGITVRNQFVKQFLKILDQSVFDQLEDSKSRNEQL